MMSSSPREVRLNTLQVGETLIVQTVNTRYLIQRVNDDGDFLIKGNPRYCPTATLSSIPGCTFGGTMINFGVLIEGSYMEFIPQVGPHDGSAILTSRIVLIERMN